jgi:hypothetical protein
VPRDGHQVRPVRVRRVVHLASASPPRPRAPSLTSIGFLPSGDHAGTKNPARTVYIY